MSVAVQSNSKSNNTTAAKKSVGQKAVPPKPNKKIAGEDRSKAKILAGVVGEGLQSATGAAVNASADVAKDVLKGGVTKSVGTIANQFRTILSLNPAFGFVAPPLIKFLTPKFDQYLESNKIVLPISTTVLMKELLYGDLSDMDGEVAKALDGFIDKAMPEDLKKAIESGSIKGISLAIGSNLTSGAKGILSQMFNVPNSNKFTSVFKFAGKKIPLINRLSDKFQPWAAGAGVFMFGGLAVKLLVKATKLLIGGTLLATGGVFVKRIFDKMSKGPSHANPKAEGGMGGAMSALANIAGGPAAAKPGMMGAPGGMGGMMNAASGLMGMFGKK